MIAWRLGQLSVGTAALSVNGDNFSHLIETGSRELVAEPEVDLNDPLFGLLPKSWKFWNLSKQHHLLRPNVETCDPVRDILDSNCNILSPSRQARYTQADRNFASTMDKCKGLFALSEAKLKPSKKRRPDSEQLISHRFAVAGKGTLGHCWWAYFSTGIKLQCYCPVWHHHENAGTLLVICLDIVCPRVLQVTWWCSSETVPCFVLFIPVRSLKKP